MFNGSPYIARAAEVFGHCVGQAHDARKSALRHGAALTGVAVNDPRRFPALEEAFPSLFEKKEQQDWWVMKQRVEEYGKAKKRN